MDLATFAGAKVERVAFERCLLTRADFQASPGVFATALGIRALEDEESAIR